MSYEPRQPTKEEIEIELTDVKNQLATETNSLVNLELEIRKNVLEKKLERAQLKLRTETGLDAE